MKKIQLNIYQFSELSEEAKQIAIEDERENKYKHGEYLYFFKELCEERAKELGFNDIKLQYSLSYCQGDGLSFECKEFTKLEELYLKVLGKGKEKTAKFLAENTWYQITGNKGHYCYASKSDVDLTIEWNCKEYDLNGNVFEVEKQVREMLEQKYIDLCKELEDAGYKEIEYENSDECIIEDIEANEYEFTEDGKIY